MQIGSGPNCTVRNECLANLHAQIELHKFSSYITNHDRVAGTILNGERVHGRANLRNGDLINCANLLLEVSFSHPLLEGEIEKQKLNTELCPTCKDPWIKRPTCSTLSHWNVYADAIERARADLQTTLDSLQKEQETNSVRIGQKCNKCGRKDVKLVCCGICLGEEEEEVDEVIDRSKIEIPQICPKCDKHDWVQYMADDFVSCKHCGYMANLFSFFPSAG